MQGAIHTQIVMWNLFGNYKIAEKWNHHIDASTKGIVSYVVMYVMLPGTQKPFQLKYTVFVDL